MNVRDPSSAQLAAGSVRSGGDVDLYTQAGGAAGLQTAIDDFVDRVCRDPMIGFFFAKVDRAQLKRLEAQFAARALGAEVVYEGRPLRQAHATHRIADGQFARRREILRQTLRDHALSDEVVAALLHHTERLRSAIVWGGQGCDLPQGGVLLTAVAASGEEQPIDWP